MQFNSIADVRAAQQQPQSFESAEVDGGHVPRSPAPDGTGLMAETSKNLLKHIPGEASGFYLISAAAFESPGAFTLLALSVMSLIILLLVRVLAQASRGILATSVIAFLLWMLVIDNGFLAVALPGFLPDPWGLILAGFYSAVVTLLATAGKIK